ncbi:MAG: ECF transporter S component [Clostridia bacterium]|nr:ECF transporter S component [Clostridia bacterium]
MKAKTTKKMSTETMVLGAIMTAMVVILQLLATFTAFFGPFSTAVALIPIVIGAVLCGPAVGAWLGLVFGIVVIASGGAALFMAFSVVGTFITVLAKGSLCGLAAGLIYKLMGKWNHYVAVITSSLICPVVNTGVFLLGCLIFFLPHDAEIAGAAGSTDTGMALFIGFAMANFIFEIVMNIVLSPVIIKLLDLRKKKK